MAPDRKSRLLAPSLLFYGLLGNVKAQVLPGLNPIPENGAPQAFTGTTVYLLGYRPICGTLGGRGSSLGDKILYETPYSTDDICDAVLKQYIDDADSAAVYEISGRKLGTEEVFVGRFPTCNCFTLEQEAGGMKGDLCVYVTKAGEIEVVFGTAESLPRFGYYARTSYRPNSSKEGLPHCWAVDTEALSASYVSSTRTSQPNTATRQSNSVEALSTTSPRNNDTRETNNDNDNQQGLSASDKISLGVGLGLGIPTLILTVVGTMRKLRGRNEGQGAA